MLIAVAARIGRCWLWAAKYENAGMGRSMATKTTAIAARHRAALTALLGTVGETPFRRSDLAKLIYPMTSPRSHPRATELAGLVMGEAARGAIIRREGHLQWVRAASHRKTLAGRKLVELPAPMNLSLQGAEQVGLRGSGDGRSLCRRGHGLDTRDP
jgi:hypothetical protein